MMIREYLRYTILGSPFMLPDIKDLIPLLNNLVLAYGFLLIGCSLFLHKLKVVEYLNSKNQENQETGYIAQLFGIRNERKDFLNVGGNFLNSGEIKKVRQNNVEIRMASSSLKDNQIVKKPKLGFLEGFTSILLKKSRNETDFKIFVKDLKSLKMEVDKLMADFKNEFDSFNKMSKTIQTELYALNSSPKYFSFEYNDLKNEVERFFVIASMKQSDRQTALLSYIKNVVDLKDINNNNKFENDSNRIFKKIGKFRYIFLVIAVIAIIFLILSVLENQVFVPGFYISLCIFLSILSVLNICILVYTQALDKDCKSGRIRGCKIYLNNGSRYVTNLRKTELFRESQIFKNDLDSVLESTNINLQNMQTYIHGLFNERVSHKILVFNNLFDKILFVRDDFKAITNNKINEKEYYTHIRNMYNILDRISSKLNEKIKIDILEIYTKEMSLGYYIKTNKDFIVDNVLNVVATRKNEEDVKLSAKCGSLLEKLCLSKEYVEDIFNLIFCFIIIIALCMI
ncbi:hypothetical protein P3W45_000008 [Vairimorpha bombi]